MIRFAFCFPDIYEIGMSHMGLHILYGLLNHMEDVACERVFAPWDDMEAALRTSGTPLFSLENHLPLSQFHIVGFTLQYELSYTNILNMLDLGGIPLLAAQRGENDPLVIAGGPCACNPEPLADFIDLFVLGEGEEVTADLIRLYRDFRDQHGNKSAFLRAAAQIPGVYVPSLYQVEHKDGAVANITPIDDAPMPVVRRWIRDLDHSFYPDKPVVPYLEVVHDRAITEIQRGCARGCRFCQAGYIYRPARQKSPDAVNTEARAICDAAGYDEVSLSSLSAGDYEELGALLDQMLPWTVPNRVSVSLPSLRVDSFSGDTLEKLRAVRRPGLTFAPEAGTQRLRDVINKNITEEEILTACRTAFAGGSTAVKLYFMIGLPTETMEDVAGIARLSQKIVDTFYDMPERPRGKAVSVHLGVSTFVPKAMTPFQWCGQDSLATIEEKQRFLKEEIRSRKIVYNWHDARTSALEAAFARGDRRLGAVLLTAFRAGCRLDGWSEHFHYDRWETAFLQHGVNISDYSNRVFTLEETLPWDHLDYGVEKRFLQTEYARGLSGNLTESCQKKCSACGIQRFEGGICVANRACVVS